MPHLVRSKAYMCCLKTETALNLNTNCEKGSNEDETAANYFKNNIQDSFQPVLVCVH